LAWEAAFLKTHYPLEFACGVLNHYDGHYPLRAIASELIRCGVSLRPPHVNYSAAAHQREEGAVRLGLCAVKFLSARHRERLLEARPFADLRDLVSRVPLNLAELESLILSGACDDLAPLAREAYPFPHEELLTRWKRMPGVAGLDGFIARNARGRFAETHRALTRIRNELRYLGMHVSDHPMRLLRPEAEQAGCITTREALDKAGQTVRLAGMVIASRRQADRQGRPVQFLTLEDEEGLLEAVVPADAKVALRDPQVAAGPLMVRGRVEGERGVLLLRVADAEPFQPRPQGSRIAEPV
jgi:DNA polymerase-3 subunit alpha/error-prone DNA polymerase